MISHEVVHDIELEVLAAFRRVLDSSGIHGLDLEATLSVRVRCITPLDETTRGEFYAAEAAFHRFYPKALVEFSAPASKAFAEWYAKHQASKAVAPEMTERPGKEGEPCKS